MKLSGFSSINGSNTALMIVDMQNAFLHKKGSYAKRGNKICCADRVIANNKKIVAAARRCKIPVIFTKLSFKRTYANAGLLVKKFSEVKTLGAYQEGSFDAEVCSSLNPASDAIVINKTRYNPFIGTPLSRILKNANVKNLVITGVLSNVCVESSARAAFDKGFLPLVVRDATSTYSRARHKNAMENINNHFGSTCTTSFLIKNLLS